MTSPFWFLLRAPVLACVSLLLVPIGLSAQMDDPPPVVYPTLPAKAPTKAALVPSGWKIESESQGDLNGDGAQDLLLVLRMTDPKNLVANEGLGPDQLDTNPRLLVVAFAGKGRGYSVALSNHTLIPRHTIPTMDDPLTEAKIVKNTVQISLGVWMSAGSWSTSQTKLTFRYQGGCFALIGYDRDETRRNTGETSGISINYLTKKAKLSKGNIENDAKTVSWKTVPVPKLLCLDAVGDGLDFDPQGDRDDEG